jgi:hypothetical protein
MSSSMTIECAFHITRRSKGRQEMQAGESPRTPCERGRVPRVAKLLALAHRFEGLVREGVVSDYAELALLGCVTRARISQIMSLLSLSPDLQEQVLFLPRTERGRDPIQMRHLLPIAQVADWKIQRAVMGCPAEPQRRIVSVFPGLDTHFAARIVSPRPLHRRNLPLAQRRSHCRARL